MKAISIRKYILGFFAYVLIAHPSSAIGLATGPSVGIAGFCTSFDTTQPLKKIATDNMALRIGWFAKLDLWLLYAKLDPSFVFDWRKLPNQLDREHFKYITLPFTIGVPCFGLLRPHIGLIFRINLDDLNDTKFKDNRFIESCRKKINGYILGLGIDLGKLLVDINFEFARLSVARKFISSALLNSDKEYRPKQFALRASYNLLG